VRRLSFFEYGVTDINMRFRIGKAIIYGILLWFTGFIWGSVVFITPALKTVPAITYVSSNPVVSFPILLLWLVLTYLLARSFLKLCADKSAEGIMLGLVLSAENFALDLIVLVFLLKAEFGYFASITVWTGYLMLFLIPWLTGMSLNKAFSRSN